MGFEWPDWNHNHPLGFSPPLQFFVYSILADRNREAAWESKPKAQSGSTYFSLHLLFPMVSFRVSHYWILIILPSLILILIRCCNIFLCSLSGTAFFFLIVYSLILFIIHVGLCCVETVSPVSSSGKSSSYWIRWASQDLPDEALGHKRGPCQIQVLVRYDLYLAFPFAWIWKNVGKVRSSHIKNFPACICEIANDSDKIRNCIHCVLSIKRPQSKRI